MWPWTRFVAPVENDTHALRCRMAGYCHGRDHVNVKDLDFENSSKIGFRDAKGRRAAQRGNESHDPSPRTVWRLSASARRAGSLHEWPIGRRHTKLRRLEKIGQAAESLPFPSFPGLHHDVDTALEISIVFDNDSRRFDVSHHVPVFPDRDLLLRVDVPVNGPLHHYFSRRDI